MVTMQDVAERAGVSLKTVSNVVNGFPSIRPSTRQRVQQVLAELGYRPNMAARSLAGGRTGLIALLIPDVDSSYFGRLTGGLTRAARASDLTVLIQQAGRTVPGELATLGSLRRHFVDGLIGNTIALSDLDIRRRMGPVPVVMLGSRWDEEHRIFDHVFTDVESAGADGIRHLLGLGRRRIALLGRREHKVAPTDRRLSGAESALVEHGLGALYGRVGSYTRTHGYRAMSELLTAEPTLDAVFCFNDDLAVGAMAALSDSGRKVPHDVAVLGFDDTAIARFTTPALSSIHYSMADLAGAVIQRLWAAIERGADVAGDYRGEDVIIPHSLQVRGSTDDRVPRRVLDETENEPEEFDLDAYVAQHPDWRHDLAADEAELG